MVADLEGLKSWTRVIFFFCSKDPALTIHNVFSKVPDLEPQGLHMAIPHPITGRLERMSQPHEQK